MHFPRSPLVALVLVLGIASVTYSWTGPTAAAPNGNIAAPINVGPTQQIKEGVLGTGGLVVFGNTLLAGDGNVTYLNFGSTSGGNGYGIRDNNGSLEFKRKDGTWITLDMLASSASGQAIARATRMFTSSGSWTVPAGVTTATVRVIGGGGGTRCGYETTGGDGGAGLSIVSGLTPTAAIPITVGKAGASTCDAGFGPSGAGGTSTFGSYVTATGGSGDNVYWQMQVRAFNGSNGTFNFTSGSGYSLPSLVSTYGKGGSESDGMVLVEW